MPSGLTITLVQSTLAWEDADANLNHFTGLLNPVSCTDIIVLPEMFTTGFSMKPELLAEESYTKGLAWMMKTAAEKAVVLCGSMMCREGDKYYNRLVWMPPNGQFLTYDKRHLFTLGDEHSHYSPGQTSFVVEYKGVKIKPLICYDLRFPVWSRNVMQKNEPVYDLLIYVANWPERRIMHWEKLLQARAIENVCYVAGVNRIGNDGNGMAHNGRSMFCNYKGEPTMLTDNETCLASFTVDTEELNGYRKAFPALGDGDTFTLL